MITDFLNFGFDICNPPSLIISYLTLVCACLVFETLVAKAGLVWVYRPLPSHLMDAVSHCPCTVVLGTRLYISSFEPCLEKSYHLLRYTSTMACSILLTMVKFFVEFSSYVLSEHLLYSSGYDRPSERHCGLSMSFIVYKKVEVIKNLW